MKTYTHLKEFKEYDKFVNNLSNMPIERIQRNIDIYQAFLDSKKKFFIGENNKVRMDRNCVKELVDLLTDFVIKKSEKDNIQTIANESKKDYINDTTLNSIGENTMNSTTQTATTLNNGDETMNSQTATTLNNGDETMNSQTATTLNNGDETMNKITQISPLTKIDILSQQYVNKTDTKKTYWGGWKNVMSGMEAAYKDYSEYEILENEWLELRKKLGGKNSPAFHYCWYIINKNRVSNKKEPNSTLRFIKNVKIRIAVAKDILANSDKYKNEIAENWKRTFGTEI